MNPDLDTLRADMDDFLGGWGESLSYTSPSLSYNARGLSVTNYSAYQTFIGDFQPLTGKEEEAESGLQQRSDVKIQCSHDVALRVSDKVLRNGETFFVNYTKVYEDHAVVFVYREVDQ